MIRSKISRRTFSFFSSSSIGPEVWPDNFCIGCWTGSVSFQSKKNNTLNNDATVYPALKNLPSCFEFHIDAWHTTWYATISFFENLKESFLSAVSRHGSSTTPFNSIYQLMIRHILVPKNTENVLIEKTKMLILKRKLLLRWEYFSNLFKETVLPFGQNHLSSLNLEHWNPAASDAKTVRTEFLSIMNLKLTIYFKALNLKLFVTHLCIGTFFTFCDFFDPDLIYKRIFIWETFSGNGWPILRIKFV